MTIHSLRVNFHLKHTQYNVNIQIIDFYYFSEIYDFKMYSDLKNIYYTKIVYCAPVHSECQV